MIPSPKQLFQSDKTRFAQLSAVINADWFKSALGVVRAECLGQPGMTPEMQRGMLTYEALLLSLCDTEEAPRPALTSGLQYDQRELRERGALRDPKPAA